MCKLNYFYSMHRNGTDTNTFLILIKLFPPFHSIRKNFAVLSGKFCRSRSLSLKNVAVLAVPFYGKKFRRSRRAVPGRADFLKKNVRRAVPCENRFSPFLANTDINIYLIFQ